MASPDYYRDVFIYYQAQPSIQLPIPPQADVSISPQSPALQQTNIRQQLDDLSSEDMASPVHHHSAITNIGTCFTKLYTFICCMECEHYNIHRFCCVVHIFNHRRFNVFWNRSVVIMTFLPQTVSFYR